MRGSSVEPSFFTWLLERSGLGPRSARTPRVERGNPGAKEMRRRLAVMLSALLLILPSCNADTCSGGQNMTDPRVLGDFFVASTTPTLRIGWEAGTELGALLPDAYFAEVVVSSDGDGALIENVSYSNERELTVVFTNLAGTLDERDALSFTLEFPDRGLHTNCTHGGMADHYLLDVTLVFDESQALQSAIFTQSVRYGPY